ncbi:MAG TPA: ATP-binding cassette domain-containing protein [Chthoniobacterales bacterium]
MARVSLKNVTKIYPDKTGRNVTAIHDLDLEIQDREFVVLVGQPNCGISSIVRMIAGLDDISKGEIFIDDHCVHDMSPKDRDIAMVSQNYAPYPRMSVYDNLAFGLKLRKLPNAEIGKRVLAAAGILGLEELLERKPEFLSGQQRQRVAIARAIALRPKVFLFDEPLASLEATTREQMRNEITKLHQRLQATMIYATHDPIEAMAMGGRIVVMNDGVIQQYGTALTLYDEPVNAFVAGFVGSPPMNFVRGALKQDRDWLLFSEVEDGTIEVRLPISEFPAGRDFVGKPVLLGIRPEEIRIAQSSKAEKYSGSFPAIIDLVEAMGAEANLYLQTGAHRLVCRTQRGVDHREAGHRAQFEMNVKKLYLFDPASTRRIVQEP